MSKITKAQLRSVVETAIHKSLNERYESWKKKLETLDKKMVAAARQSGAVKDAIAALSVLQGPKATYEVEAYNPSQTWPPKLRRRQLAIVGTSPEGDAAKILFNFSIPQIFAKEREALGDLQQLSPVDAPFAKGYDVSNLRYFVRLVDECLLAWEMSGKEIEGEGMDNALKAVYPFIQTRLVEIGATLNV